ncbi:MAG: hypothetical protein LBI33_01330, partial [Propionibacteriaceae bacterium]|nr:hypothetical protein [Propionibacteriaceae bacterium]
MGGKKDIKRLIQQIDQTYWGPEERALIDEAIALAREIGDEGLEYEVRMRLTASAARTGDNDAMLSSFAWCLAKHDADPRRFPRETSDGLADLMWQFKWMTGALDACPIFSLAQCEAMLDDMETHYRAENLGPSGVITARFLHAWAVGDLDRARALRTTLLATPRDEHSNCEACGPSDLAGFALETGEPDLALKLVDEIIAGGYSCGEEPEHALSRTLVAKLRAGRSEDALDSHLRSYRLARRNPDNITIVADNLVFCAITGNEARGLAMVERHIGWLAHDSLNERGQVNLLAAIGVVLEAVARAGYGDQVVRGATAPDLTRFFGPEAGTGPVWTVADLVPRVWAATTRLTRAFDERNGNTYVSGLVAATRGLLAERYDLPVATEVFLPPAPPAAEPVTPAAWLDLGETLVWAQLPADAIRPLTRAAESDDLTIRGRALQMLIASYVETDDGAAAERRFPERLAALRAAGRTLQAETEECVGLVMFGAQDDTGDARLTAQLERLTTPGRDEPDLPDVLADVELTLALDRLRREPDGDITDIVRKVESAVAHASRSSLKANALLTLAQLQAGAGHLEEALTTVNAVLALDVAEGIRAVAHRERARLLGGLERYEEGVADADAATALYAAYGVGQRVIANIVLAAALLDDAERYEEEVARLRYAQREAQQLGIPTMGIEYRLGRALTAAGQPRAAVELLWEVLRTEEAGEASAADRAETCQSLAEGLEAAEQYGNAASMYEQTADLLVEAENPVPAANMLRRRSNLFRGFEMYDEALEAVGRAWELLQEPLSSGEDGAREMAVAVL